MTGLLTRGGRARAIGVSIAAVGGATTVVALLAPFAPNLALGVIYLFAVLPVGAFFGVVYAAAVAVASMITFVWFFLPRLHSFELRGWQNWVALLTYLATALAVGALASRAQRRNERAERREREAALLAECATALLESTKLDSGLEVMSGLIARGLGLSGARIEIGVDRRAAGGGRALPLVLGQRHLGFLYCDASAPAGDALVGILGALASLVAIAVDREQLAEEAVETEALRRSETAKTAVLRSVSHDLQSPLTAIRAAADGLRDASLALDDNDRTLLLSSIVAETSRLERLIRNLLDLSRLEAKAALPEPDVWQADELVELALAALGSHTDCGRIRIRLPEVIPCVSVDAAQIERALANLLENALKFSPPDSPVDVAVEADNDRNVLIRVFDRGPGVAPADLGHLCEPFRRGMGSAAIEGSGLGLAIALAFVEANGGRLEVAPRDQGGSEFTLVLSLAGIESPLVPAWFG